MTDDVLPPPPGLAAPPRKVPLSLAWHLRFGDKLAMIGWFFLGIGLIVLLGTTDFRGAFRALQLAEGGRIVEGRVLGWRETELEVNGALTLAHTVSFPCREGTCECEGFQDGVGLAADTVVKVEFLPEDAAVCRVEGMRQTLAPWWLVLVLAPFVLIGLGLMAVPFLRGRRQVALLRRGLPAGGKVLGTEPTGLLVDGDRVYRVRLRFTDARGADHEVTVRTTEPDELSDERRERLLYDPARPARVLALDLLPAGVGLTPEGHWRPVSAATVASSAWVPVFLFLFLLVMLTSG